MTGAIVRAVFCLIVAAAISAIAEAGEKTRIVALIIGNNAYRGAPELKQAIADADAVDRKLKELGVDKKDITNLRNATHVDILRGVDTWSVMINQDDIAVLYFAGHGFTQGASYITAVDFEKPVAEANFEERAAIQIKDVLGRVESRLKGDPKKALPKVIILILDACRSINGENKAINIVDSTSVRSWARSRSAPLLPGLDKGNTPEFINDNKVPIVTLYSTALGQPSLENLRNKNSLYTTFLLKRLERGVSLSRLAEIVSADVRTATGETQIPTDGGPSYIKSLQLFPSPQRITFTSSPRGNGPANGARNDRNSGGDAPKRQPPERGGSQSGPPGLGGGVGGGAGGF